MYKENKFRGKRIDTNEWIYGGYFKDGDIDIIVTANNGNVRVYEVVSETVGQYIGVNDVDNGEIYEDDIVSQESNIPYSLLFIRGYINFLYGQFVITSSLGNGELNSFTTTIKILGNRFDNPELLIN